MATSAGAGPAGAPRGASPLAAVSSPIPAAAASASASRAAFARFSSSRTFRAISVLDGLAHVVLARGHLVGERRAGCERDACEVARMNVALAVEALPAVLLVVEAVSVVGRDVADEAGVGP